MTVLKPARRRLLLIGTLATAMTAVLLPTLPASATTPDYTDGYAICSQPFVDGANGADNKTFVIQFGRSQHPGICAAEQKAIDSIITFRGVPNTTDQRDRVVEFGRGEVAALILAELTDIIKRADAGDTLEPWESDAYAWYQQQVADTYLATVQQAQVEYQTWGNDACNYTPPAPYTYDPYTGQTCSGATELGGLFTGGPNPPTYQDFLTYGVARYADDQAPTLGSLATQTLQDEALLAGVAGAGLITWLSTTVSISAAVAGLETLPEFLQVIYPIVGQAPLFGEAAIGPAIAVALIVAGIARAVQLTNAGEIGTKLADDESAAQTIADDPSSIDLGLMLNNPANTTYDVQLLLGAFTAALAPVPGPSASEVTAATPDPSASTPWFQITDGTTTTVTHKISFASFTPGNSQVRANYQAWLDHNWWVVQEVWSADGSPLLRTLTPTLPLALSWSYTSLLGLDLYYGLVQENVGYVPGSGFALGLPSTDGSSTSYPPSTTFTFLAPLNDLSSADVTYVTASLTKADQTITVNTAAPGTATYGDTFTVDASASSGLDVSYAGSGSCSNAGATFTMTSGTGECTVTVSQAGDDNYTAAADVVETVTAAKADQTISFDLGGLPDVTYGDSSFDIGSYASASSGLAVSFSSATPEVCTIDGSTVSVTAAGNCTIDADQRGDDNYSPAAQVSQSFSIAKPTLTVTASSPNVSYGDPVPTITASYDGWVGTDDESVLSTDPTCSTTYTQGDSPGTYPSSCSGAAADNYTMNYVDGTVTVDKADLTVTADDQSVQYSDPLPTLTVHYTGFVGSDDPSVLGGTLSCRTDATVTDGQVLSPAGTYPITCNGLTSTDYAVDFVGGTLTVGAEDTVVRLAQNNPHAVPVDTSGKNKGEAPAMTFTARITETADGSYGDISQASPITLTLDPVGPGSTITCDAAVTKIQPATATSPGFELVSCTVPDDTPINVYQVSLTVGGTYYQGGDDSVLTVYDPTAGGSAGCGLITNPNTGNTAEIAYTASYLKNGKQVQGKFLYIARDGDGNVVHVLKGNVMSALAITGDTAVVTGKATLDGVGNYSYILSGIDNAAAGNVNPANKPDQFGLQLTDPAGNTVDILIFDSVDVTEGNIYVGE